MSRWPLTAVAMLLAVTAAPVAAAAPESAATCAYTLPKGGQRWRVERAWATGSDEADARQRARDKARQQLDRDLRGVYPDADRAAIVGSLRYVGDAYDPATRTACVTALVEKPDLPAAAKAPYEILQGQLARLVEALPRVTRARRLRLLPPQWSTGLGAGELGERLRVQIEGALGAAERGYTLDPRAKHSLGFNLAPSGTGCAVTPYVRDARGRRKPLPGLTVPPQALGLRTCASVAPSAALGDPTLGLVDGERAGADGLRVQLWTSADDRPLCGGEPYDVFLRTNRPARVRIYAVASDGRVAMGWPEQAVDGEHRVTPPGASVHLGPDLGYRLVAVAVPKGLGFGDFRPATPADAPDGCLGRKGLRAADFPPTAALAALPQTVRAPDAPSCRPGTEARALHQRLLAFYDALPTCRTDGGRW